MFGLMLMLSVKGILAFLIWGQHDLNSDQIVAIIIAIIGAVTAFGVAITKLSEDSPPPDPTVPADLHARLIEKIR